MPTNRLLMAHAIALLLPLALMAGALGSQYLGGLFPCEMCMWQRYPHYTAIVLALIGFFVPGRGLRTLFVVAAALAIAVSGVIGFLHVGVEQHWWPTFTACGSTLRGGSLADIMKAPIVACDRPQWTFFGISLAAFNMVFSLAGAGVVAWLLARRNAA